MPHPQARPRVTTRSHEVQDHHQHRHTPTTHTAHRHTPRGPASPACRDARAATDRHRDREPWPNHVWPKLSQSRGQYTESFGHGSCAAVHISYYMSCLWRARRSSIINVVEDRFVWLRGVNNTTCFKCACTRTSTSVSVYHINGSSRPARRYTHRTLVPAAVIV
jgi:hypothetical protein